MEWKTQAFEARPSLWALVQEYAPEKEQTEIKYVLGEDLVDETVDLHQEVKTLLEIWSDYREETEKEQQDKLFQQHLKSFPEPPLVRENLEQEIKLFIDCLKQRNKDTGQCLKSVLTRKDSEVLEHVLEKTDKKRTNSVVSSRPQTASTRDGRETPLRSTPNSDRNSGCASSLSDTLDCIQDRINALDIDNISQHLRDLLQSEKEGLLEDIQFLQECLVEETDYRQQLTSSPSPEPSIKALRDVGTKLEKELLHTSSLPVGQHGRPPVGNISKIAMAKKPLIKSASLEPISSRENSPTLVPKPPSSPPEKPSSRARIHGKGATTLTLGRFTPSPPSSAKTSLPRNPSPPTSAKSSRPTSASKFRKMVVECRESGGGV